jgi:hypothetical protein
VRVLRLVGERVLPEDFASFKRHFVRGARFVNAYSLTEVGNVTMSVLTHDSIVPDDILPVGYPRPGRCIRIVDEAGEAVPPGVAGEIVVENPYVTSPDRPGMSGPTMFRTGDLGRMDPDGLLFHLGRRDFQVKIRGFRVEIEGVEAILVRAPGIMQSAVVVRKNSQGESMLVAYTAGDSRLVDVERLRAFAVSHLPEGSVPSRFVLLDTLPLTASGKVDRRALTALEEATPAHESPASWSARSAVELAVAGIWRELLGHDQFGAHDGFLEAGGDSLLAMRVLTRVRQQLGMEIALPDFLSEPTVAVRTTSGRVTRNSPDCWTRSRAGSRAKASLQACGRPAPAPAESPRPRPCATAYGASSRGHQGSAERSSAAPAQAHPSRHRPGGSE